MKDLFIISDTPLNKVSYYYLALFIATLPFDRFYSSLLLIGFIAITLLNTDKRKLRQLLSTKVLLLQAIYIVTVFSSIYASDLKQAMNEWEKQLAILLIPAALTVNAINLIKYRGRLLYVFSFSCIFNVIYLYADAFSIIRFYQLPASAIVSASFINQNFAAPIDMHASYLSLYIGVAFIFLLTRVLQARHLWVKTLHITGLLVLGISIVQLSAKSVSIALLLILLFVLPFFLTANQRKLFIPLTLVASIVAAIFILKADMLNERYLIDLKKDLYQPIDNTTGAEYRLVRWRAAIELIAEKPLLGYGAGMEIDMLKERYFQNRLYFSYLSSFNAHNQYLSCMLTAGLMGLLTFIAVLVYFIRKAWLNRDLMLLSCMLLIALLAFSENVLSVNKGIFFVAFFIPFLSFSGPIVARWQKKKMTKDIFTNAATSVTHAAYQEEDALQLK